MRYVMMITLVACLTGCQALGSGCDTASDTSDNSAEPSEPNRAEPPGPVAEEGDGYRPIFTRGEIGYGLQIVSGTPRLISTPEELRSFLTVVRDQSQGLENLDEDKIDIDFSHEVIIFGVRMRSSIPAYGINAYWVDETSLELRREVRNGDLESDDMVLFLDMFAVDTEKVESVRFGGGTVELTGQQPPALRLLFEFSDGNEVIEFDKRTVKVIQSPDGLDRLASTLSSMVRRDDDEVAVATQMLREHPVDFDKEALALLYGVHGESSVDDRKLVVSAVDEDEATGRLSPKLTGVLLDLEQLDALEYDGEIYALEVPDKVEKDDE